jgi:uncharacterized Ntn-hydrolase superfamily protein
MSNKNQKPISTFSIVARDPVTKELGIAVQSKFLAVGAVVPWAKANVGAIATQAMANLDYGEIGLKLLEKGYTASQVLESLLALDEKNEGRQVGIVDAEGNSAAYTGPDCFDWAGHISKENFTCQGNILIGEDTVKAMAETFEKSKGKLSDRLLEALDMAQNAGGDKRGRQSAALLVVKENGSYGGYNDRMIDLRVDDNPKPIKKLKELLYLQRLYFEKPEEKDRLEVDNELGKTIQRTLKKIGYYDGEINGNFDEATKKAYFNFTSVENFEERRLEGNKVDKKVIDFMVDKSKNTNF